jgi:2-methylcitrate synthase
MSEHSPSPTAFKPKKSVALSGTPAGNTALCTVGHSGNDLHYRGYDIKDLAAHCEFEEVAHLLVHGRLPNAEELAGYKSRLRPLRSLPAAVKQALELLPPSTHPMDVLRTGVSVLGCVLPEALDHGDAGARAIADALLASLSSMLLYWHHYARKGRRIVVEAFNDSGNADIFDSVCGARVQRVHIHGAGDCGNGVGFVFRNLRGDWSAQRSETWRGKRGGAGDSGALRLA